MKGLAITHKGFEDICSQEINELIGAKVDIKDSCVMFDIKNKEDLCLLCYKAQSVSRIMFLLDSGKLSKLEDMKKGISKLDLSGWIDKDKTIAVRSMHDEKWQTQEVEPEVGSYIIEHIKNKQGFEPKVNLENPDIMFFVFINNSQYYLGIDFAGFDLSKRDYKIFSHAGSIKGSLAYCLVRLSEFNISNTGQKGNKPQKLADPFCKDGTIVIEAALSASNMPVNYYRKDKLLFNKFIEFDFDKVDKQIKDVKDAVFALDDSFRNISSAKKNAKIAGVQKSLNFARFDMEWLDTKFEKKTVHSIVTIPPQASKNIDKKDIEKRYKEFFYQMKYVLAKGGRIVLLMHKAELIKQVADSEGFKLVEERAVSHGKESLDVLVFGV